MTPTSQRHQGGSRSPRRARVSPALGVLSLVAGIAAVAAAFAAGHGPSAPARAAAPVRPAALLAPLVALQKSSGTTSTAPADLGDPTARITAPAGGSTVAAGTAVQLAATLSADLRAALQAGTGGSCYFLVADGAGHTAPGTVDTTSGTCTGSWTFAHGGTATVTAVVNAPSTITYSSPPVTVTVTGGADPRCTGGSGAPSGCVYRWTEVYYTSTDARQARVCSIDGGCLWQTAHTSWRQVAGADYWVNSTGAPLADGDLADAYLCLGSSTTGWNGYTNTHDFGALLARADTNALPVPAGTC